METKASYKGLFKKGTNEFSPSHWRHTAKERGLLDQHKLAYMDSFVKDLIERSELTDMFYEGDYSYFTFKGKQYKSNIRDWDRYSKIGTWEEATYTPIKKEDIKNISTNGIWIEFTYNETRYRIKNQISTSGTTIHLSKSGWEEINGI